MHSAKMVFSKFQAKFFKNTCGWAHFLQSSRLLACNFTKNELFHKFFQGFFLDYQNILFTEQLFMGHSWQRAPNTLHVMKTPLYCLLHLFKILFNLSSLLPPTFTSTAIFDVLFLWLKRWLCHIWCAILVNGIMDL